MGGGGKGKGKGGWAWAGYMPKGYGYFSPKGKGKGGQPKGLMVDPSLKVWIGDLAPDVKWKELQTHMDQAGKSKWVEVFSGKGRGTAAVAYSTPEEASSAIATLNGTELCGKPIVVDVWVRAKAKEAPDAEADGAVPAPSEQLLGGVDARVGGPFIPADIPADSFIPAPGEQLLGGGGGQWEPSPHPAESL